MTLSHPNSGYTLTDYAEKFSLVFIGNATGGDQWWDTTAHEALYHAIYAIHEYYDIPFGSEDGAWLTGYVMRKAVQLLGEPCR